MHDDLDLVSSLQRRLAVHRRTLDVLQHQRAQFGAFMPIYIWHQFDEARAEIARIKQELRAFGVAVEDRFDEQEEQFDGFQADAAFPDRLSGLLLTYQRMLLDQTRNLSLLGMSRWSHLNVRLADVYVERALVPAGAPSEAKVALAEAVRQPGARVLLEGGVGSGKSTILARLALIYAARALGDGESERFDLLGQSASASPVPLLFPANEIALALVRTDAAPSADSLPTLAAFWSAIETWLRHSDLAGLAPTLQRLLDQGRALVMIDGLDNLPASVNQHAYVAALLRFVARYPANRYVVTSRSDDPDLLAPLASFAHYRLPALVPQEVDALVERWYAAVADQAGIFVPEDVQARVAALRGALQGDPCLNDLARMPLSLVLCILAHVEGHALPADRLVVLRRFADVLSAGWGQARLASSQSADSPPDANLLGLPERRLALLAPLARAFVARMPAASERPAALSAAEVAAAMRQGLVASGVEPEPRVELIAKLAAQCHRHGLLARAGRDMVAMPHPHVRDALAALALAAQPDFPARAYALRREQRWRPVLVLAQRELSRRSAQHVGRLLIRLLLHQAEPSSARDSNDLLLAAECLADMSDRSQPSDVLRREVRACLLELIDAGEQPLAERVRAGLLLGRLGDPRFGDALPPLARVAAGPFTLGTADGYEDEGPPQQLDLPEFAIGIHAITNHEYGAFLASHPRRPRPHYWDDPRFNNPSAPIVGVTWHDAVAYCAWLSDLLERAGRLPPGMVVRLPTEFEWEKAASWEPRISRKRRYPWGDEWDSALANTADGRGAWFTAPAGCYPASASPYGLQDCIGNVWEWTASVYASYPGSAAAFREEGSYTLRGSSCASNPTHARCTYRSRLPATHWRYHLGFRIAIGPPLEF